MLAEAGPPVVDETLSLSLEARLEHSKWSTRVHGYEELTKKLKESMGNNGKYFTLASNLLKKICDDKNVMAKEKGLDVLIAFFDRFEHAKKHILPLLSSLVESLGGRQKTQSLSQELLLMMVEIDTAEPVIAALVKGTENKQPKIVSVCITTIAECLKTYGIKVFPTKIILKVFVKWFEHSIPTVRDAAQNFAVELCRWLGVDFVQKPYLENLRESQLKELLAAFEILPKTPPVPLKLLRSQQSQGIDIGSAAQQGPVKVDTYALSESVNVLNQLTDDNFYQLLLSKKWDERKEALETLYKFANVPKIANGDYSPVIRMLVKALADNNVRVVESSVLCIGILAKGLRKSFASHAKTILPILLEKFKEKKAPVVKALHEAIGHMQPHCFVFTDVMDEVITSAKSKVPSIKTQTLVLILSCLKNTSKALLAKKFQPIASILMDLMEDMDETIRESSYETFATLAVIVGERPLQGFFAKLDKVREKKVRDFMEKVIANSANTTANTTTESNSNSNAVSPQPVSHKEPEPAKAKPIVQPQPVVQPNPKLQAKPSPQPVQEPTPTQKAKEKTLKNDESNRNQVPQRRNLLISNPIRTLIAPKANEKNKDGPSLLRTPLIQPLQIRELPETPSILKGNFATNGTFQMEFDSAYEFPQQGLLFPKLSPLSSDVFSDKNDENMKSKKFKADNVPNFNIKINNEMEIEDYKSKNNSNTVNNIRSNGNSEMEVEHKVSVSDQYNSNNSNIVVSTYNTTANNGKRSGNGMEVENKVNVNEDNSNIVVNNVYNTSRDPNYSFEMTIVPRSDKVAQLLKRADNAMNEKKSIDKSKFDLDIKGFEAANNINHSGISAQGNDSKVGLPSNINVLNNITDPTPVLQQRQVSKVSDQLLKLIELLQPNDKGKLPTTNSKLRIYQSLASLIKKSDPATLVSFMDPLIISLSYQIKILFGAVPTGEVNVSLRNLIDLLKIMFESKDLMKSTTESACATLIHALFHCILDEKMSTIENSSRVKVSSEFNVLVRNILENLDRSTCFLVLIKEMRDSIDTNPKADISKYTLLLIKCLMQITKEVNAETIDNLNLTTILHEVHLFLVCHPPSHWKSRANVTPLNLIKSILKEFVSIKNKSIVKYLTTISLSSKPTPVIVSFITQILQKYGEAVVDLSLEFQKNYSSNVNQPKEIVIQPKLQELETIKENLPVSDQSLNTPNNSSINLLRARLSRIKK